MRQPQKKFVDSLDEFDGELTKDHERKSSTPSEATSTSQKGDNVEQDGRCSASGSQGSQSQRQSYRTEHYEMGELIDMMNFLIDNDRISSCYSINTWELMARDKSKRQPRSLLKQFKEMLAPNIAQVLRTMSRIWEKQLFRKFMEAHEEAQIFENPSSVSLAKTLSSSSADSSKVEAASTKLQKSIASKEPKTPTSSASRKSLDGTVISDPEEETDTKDTRLIKVPPLVNGSAGQRPVVKESSQSEIKKSEPVTSDIRITKELGKSADAVPTPSIIPKTEPKEDEDDVVLIEAAVWNDETKLVEVKPPIEPSDESTVETVIMPPVVNRQNDENKRQMQLVEEESRTELNGERKFSNCLKFDQDEPRSPSVPPNAGESHFVGIEEEKREKNHPTTPEAKIPSRTERNLKNESQTLTPGTPPLQVNSSCRRNDVKQEKPCTSAFVRVPCTIAHSRTNVLNNEELIIKEEFPVTQAEVDPRLALIDEEIYQEYYSRVLAVKLDPDEAKPSTTPEQERQSWYSVPENTPSHLRSPLKFSDLPEISNSFQNEESPARSLKFPAKELPSSQRCGLQLEEMQNCINRFTDVQSAVPLNEVDFSVPDDEGTLLPPVQETRLKVPMLKNSGINVKKSRKRSNSATGSDAHDDADDMCSDPMRTAKKQRHEIANIDSDYQSFSDTDARSVCPCRTIKLWERMYGSITVGRRKCRNRIEFKKDFSIERKKLPEDSEFSQELLNALNHDMRYTIQGQDILADLAVLHYFICRPRDIQSIGGRRVFEKIYDLKWKILQTKFKISGLGFNRFHNYIRGYIDKFGLPEEIMNVFLHWEWKNSLRR